MAKLEYYKLSKESQNHIKLAARFVTHIENEIYKYIHPTTYTSIPFKLSNVLGDARMMPKANRLGLYYFEDFKISLNGNQPQEKKWFLFNQESTEFEKAEDRISGFVQYYEKKWKNDSRITVKQECHENILNGNYLQALLEAGRSNVQCAIAECSGLYYLGLVKKLLVTDMNRIIKQRGLADPVVILLKYKLNGLIKTLYDMEDIIKQYQLIELSQPEHAQLYSIKMLAEQRKEMVKLKSDCLQQIKAFFKVSEQENIEIRNKELYEVGINEAIMCFEAKNDIQSQYPTDIGLCANSVNDVLADLAIAPGSISALCAVISLSFPAAAPITAPIAIATGFMSAAASTPKLAQSLYSTVKNGYKGIPPTVYESLQLFFLTTSVLTSGASISSPACAIAQGSNVTNKVVANSARIAGKF